MSFEKHFRVVIEKIFNYWPNLKLAVEHGMGGRNGQKVIFKIFIESAGLIRSIFDADYRPHFSMKEIKIAIQIMDYTYDYCIGNEKITVGELQDVIEDLMDQEFNTLCDDNSIPEICKNILRYLQMCKDGKYQEIEAEFQHLPSGREWLKEDVTVPVSQENCTSDEFSDDSCSDSDMDVDSEPCSSKNIRTNESSFVEPEPGWTTVRSKKKN